MPRRRSDQVVLPRDDREREELVRPSWQEVNETIQTFGAKQLNDGRAMTTVLLGAVACEGRFGRTMTDYK